MTLVAICLVIS